MTPERLEEINAQAKGDPMVIARELVAEINGLEAERDQARGFARHAYSRWPAPVFWRDVAEIDPDGVLPGWLTDCVERP